MSNYQPPLTVTPRILALVAEISEQVGLLTAYRDGALTPQLRRGNRIRTIQASLAIENNTLSVEQVTALLDGKRVLGLPREIQEVRNAFATYDAMPGWRAESQDDLLTAHGMLMHGLIDDAGRYRRGGGASIAALACCIWRHRPAGWRRWCRICCTGSRTTIGIR